MLRNYFNDEVWDPLSESFGNTMYNLSKACLYIIKWKQNNFRHVSKEKNRIILTRNAYSIEIPNKDKMLTITLKMYQITEKNVVILSMIKYDPANEMFSQQN